MFRDDVAEHYRRKGYRLHENVKVRGSSGATHVCDLIAQGPLGNLVVAFEDEGGFEGPELGAVHRTARDVGATPVVAIPQPTDMIQQAAARVGVVVLDEDALARPDPVQHEITTSEPDYPPWPDPHRDRRSDGEVPWPSRGRKTTIVEDGPVEPRELDLVVEEALRPEPTPSHRKDPGIFRYPRDGASPDPVPDQAPAKQPFGWLPKTAPAPAPEASEPEIPVRAPEAKGEMLVALRVAIAALVAGAAAGVAYFLLQSSF